MTALLPPGVKVHLALGFIDMRKGIDGLAMLVQGVLQQDPFTGHLFVFRGRTRANLIKIVFWDGTGLCLFTKRLEHGVFVAPERRCGRDGACALHSGSRPKGAVGPRRCGVRVSNCLCSIENPKARGWF
jgi:transposase